MPVEAASILHRAELAGEISADAASLAHADLGRLRVEYFPYDPLAERIWELRSPGLAAPPGSQERARLLFPPGPASSGTDDPAQMLGAGYEQQVEMLRRIRRGVADCDTARKRVELQMTALAQSSGELERRADEARAAGRSDLAQESLARKNAVEAELALVAEVRITADGLIPVFRIPSSQPPVPGRIAPRRTDQNRLSRDAGTRAALALDSRGGTIRPGRGDSPAGPDPGLGVEHRVLVLEPGERTGALSRDPGLGMGAPRRPGRGSGCHPAYPGILLCLQSDEWRRNLRMRDRLPRRSQPDPAWSLKEQLRAVAIVMDR